MTKITVLKRRAFLKVLISEIGKSSAGEESKKDVTLFLRAQRHTDCSGRVDDARYFTNSVAYRRKDASA